MAASLLAVEYFGSRLFMKSYDHDPGATTEILASPDGGTTPWYMDMRDYLRGAVLVRPTIIGGTGLTRVKVYASTDVLGATSATLIKDSGAVAGDSLNDAVFLEWQADEIAFLGGTLALRYITVGLTMGTGTDEANVTFIGLPKFPRTGLTATLIT